jgi:predicted nucleotidyltransferase
MTQTEDSDIDLCIILENPQMRTIEIGRSIRKDIYPVLKRPLDILVYDRKHLMNAPPIPCLWNQK